MIERRRIWTDAVLADYIRDELGFPGARQGAMVEKETVDIATGEVSRERWYLLTSLSSRQWGPRELLRLFRNHWSVENSLHHVKDRSWDEDVHTLCRPGLEEVFAALVNTGLNALRLEGWFPPRMSMPLRAKSCAFRPTQTIARLSPLTNVVTQRLVSQVVRRRRNPEHRTLAPVGSLAVSPGAWLHATPAADAVVRSIRRQHPRTPGHSAAWCR